ncbi:MAG: SRPBCC domain-containing protein [Anaerolineaceae bacterium]|nr:SRPBCC domain-containing protein [Anaerolineaceae bacterium]
MTASAYDWTQFTRRIFIQAEIERVFRAWAVPAEIIQWFVAQADHTAPDGAHRPADTIAIPGDAYAWRWHQDAATQGEILRIVENTLLQFTFGKNNNGEPIIVTVTFQQNGDETIVELRQDNITDTPTDRVSWHLSCNLGWSFFMTNLKAWLEHGIDLREKNPERAYETRAISL